jgi:hypothetical protein
MQVKLTPEEVTAKWLDSTLVIHGSGHEDGVADITIERLADEVWPPEFEVVGEQSPAIGMFPYAVTRTFALAERPDEILIATGTGEERVPVG